MGTKINSAKDDAAGMAITNKLKAQLQGLRTASQNSLDGVSLIQTAEGALSEVHNMLQRMRELCVQAANDTNVPEDREKIKIEFDNMAQELTAVASRTEFNKIKLFSGELYKHGADDEIDNWLDNTVPPIDTNFINDLTLQIGPNARMEMDFSIPKITASTLELGWYYDGTQTIDSSIADPPTPGEWMSAWEWEWRSDNATPPTYTAYKRPGNGVETYHRSEELLATVDLAVSRISSVRARMGAAQNRLEHTILSLDTTAINTDLARSRLEDTDMALETTEYSTRNVIAQAAISIIAQANQRPQSILQLL
jgi:flagellin